MEIRPTLPPLASPSSPQIQQALSSWRNGQVLEATVIDKPADNTVLLKVGDVVLAGKAAELPDLPKGTLVKLEVINLGANISLKLLPPTPASLPPPLAEPLRQWLPKQSPLAPLLSNLAALATTTNADFPRAAHDAVRQFLATLPSVKGVTQPRALQQTVTDSGAFLEHKLQRFLDSKNTTTSAFHNALRADIKQALLTLAASLDKGSSEPPRTSAATASSPTTMATSPPTTPIRPTTTVAATPPLAPMRGDVAGKTDAATVTGATIEPSAVELPSSTVADDSQSRRTASAETRTTTATSTLLARSLADLPAPLKGAPLIAQPRVAADLTAASLPTLLRELRDQVEGAVARLTATQLSHTSQNDATTPWHITCELPVRRDNEHIDVIGLRIAEEEARQRDPAKRRFNVTLSFDFPETGPFYAHIRVIDKLVSCSFQAEHSQTALLVNRELTRLASELSRAGLNVGDLNAQQGRPAGIGFRSPLAPLVDTSA